MPGPPQAVGRIAAIDDNVQQLNIVDDGHGEDLLRLRLERNTVIRMPVRENPDVPDRFHQAHVGGKQKFQ